MSTTATAFSPLGAYPISVTRGTLAAKDGNYVFRMVAGTLTVASRPGAPAGLKATPGNSLVTLSWTAPASNGGKPVTDYVVQFKTASATAWSTFVDGPGTRTSATVTRLTNGGGMFFGWPP